MKRLTVVSLEPGDNKTYPRPGDILTVDYTGVLAENRKQFDTSIGKKPFVFTLGASQVIKGWDEGFAELSKGEKAELHIPASMGYGEQGYDDDIPPNSDLIFTVHLIDIQRQRGSEPFTPVELTDEQKKEVSDSFIPDAYMPSSDNRASKPRNNKKSGKKKGKKKR